MMQICTALHFMTSRLRRRGLNSFCYYLFNYVAGMVKSSEVQLRVATLFVLEQVPVFQGTYSLCEFSVAALQRPTSRFYIYVFWPRSTLRHPSPAYKTMVGSSMAAGFTRLDVRYRVTQGIAAIHIHIVVMDECWMIDRCYRLLRFHATQVPSIPTAVTGHHITPQVFLAGYFGSGCQTYIQ